MAAKDDTAAKKRVADERAAREKDTKESANITKGHPTPTQAELDHAKMGVLPQGHHLQDDGTHEVRYAMTRSMESRPSGGGGYQTRSAAPRSSPGSTS